MKFKSLTAKFAALLCACGFAFSAWADNVAKIGDTEYATLAAAVDAVPENGAEATTITMIANTELDATVQIPANKDVTIDLNGKAITVTETTGDHIYALQNLGKLTLKDSSEPSTGSISARGMYNGSEENSTAELVVESGTYVGVDSNGGAPVFNYAVATINGGTFRAGGYALNNRSGATMVVNNVTVDQAGSGVFYTYGANLIVENANVDLTCNYYVFYVDGGATVVVNGGNYKKTGTNWESMICVGTAPSSTVITNTITINDGTYELAPPSDKLGTNPLIMQWVDGGYARIVINGGTIIGTSQNLYKLHSGLENSPEYAEVYITGGKFYTGNGVTAEFPSGTSATIAPESVLSGPLTDDYGKTYYTVVPPNYVAQIISSDGATTNGYANISDAISAISAGCTLKLLDNAAISSAIAVANNLTVDLNGFTLTSSALAFDVASHGSLVLTGDGTIIGGNGAINVAYNGDRTTSLTLAGVTITATGSDAIVWGVHYGTITIADGTVNNVTATTSGMAGIYAACQYYSTVAIDGNGTLIVEGAIAGVYSDYETPYVTANVMASGGSRGGFYVRGTGKYGNKGIQSGLYSNDVSSYCADGYVCIANDDEDTSAKYPYAVKSVMDFNVVLSKDGEVMPYDTIGDALNAAGEGAATIYLYADLTENVSVAASQNITFAGGTKTLTGTVSVAEGGSLAVRSGKFTSDPDAVLDYGYAAELEGGVYTVGVRQLQPDENDEDTFHIYTLDDLAAFRNMVNEDGNDFFAQTVILEADVDMSPISNWEPIGTAVTEFSGDFIGNNHKLSGMTVVGNSDVVGGLFRSLGDGAGVDNLRICGATVSGTYAGALAYETGRWSIIDGVYVDAETTVTGSSYAAGLVGFYAWGDILNCWNYSTVNGGLAAGIAVYGNAENSTWTITVSNCVNKGTINGTSQTGGILAYAHHANVMWCYNAGTVTKTSASNAMPAGGIVSVAGASPVISYCLNTGDITVIGVDNANCTAGGIVGHDSGGTSTIKYCDNTGNVSNSNYRASGIAGSIYGLTLRYCRNSGDVFASACAAGISATPAYGSPASAYQCLVAGAVSGTPSLRFADGNTGGYYYDGDTLKAAAGADATTEDALAVLNGGEDDAFWLLDDNGKIITILVMPEDPVFADPIVQIIRNNEVVGQYSSLAAAVAAAQSGDTVQMLADIDLNGGSAVIDKGLILDGDGHSLSTTTSAWAIKIGTSAPVTVKNLVIPQAQRGVNINTHLASDSETAEFHVTVTNVQMVVDQRGVSLFGGGTAGSELNVIDCQFRLSGTGDSLPYKNYEHYRGISIWNTQSSTVNIVDCRLDGFSYDINVAGYSANTYSTFNIIRTEATGRSMLNVRGSYNTFNVTDCEINGYNWQTGPTERFASIMEYSGSNYNVYNFDQCRFTANLSQAAYEAGGNASQQMIGLRGYGATVTIRGNTVSYEPSIGAEPTEPSGRFGLIELAYQPYSNGNKFYLDTAATNDLETVLAALTSVVPLAVTAGVDGAPVTGVKLVAPVASFVVFPEGERKFATFADAIAAADAAGVDSITILNGTTTSPDSNWKVDNGLLVRKVYVAQIVKNEGATTNKYESLDAAVKAAIAGDTIEVIDDDWVSLTSGGEIEINKPLTITGAVNEDGEPIYTIWGTPNNTGFNDVFVASSSGTVTISNLGFCDFGSEASESVNGHAPIFVSSGNNSVVLDNLWIFYFNRTAIKINGGEFLVTDCYIDCWTEMENYRIGGMDVANAATGAIVGTTIENVDTSDPSKWVPAGLELIGSGAIRVEDCSITSSMYGIFTSTASGTSPGSSAVTVVNTTVEAEVYALINDSDKGAVIAVQSGAFTGLLSSEEEGGLTISGGIFDREVYEEYCAAGYVCVENTDSETRESYPYTVREAYVAQIGETKYETLAAAILAAQDGDTVKLLANVEEGAIVAISKTITLDLNGFELRGTLKATSSTASNYVLTLSVPVTILGNGGRIVSEHGYGIGVLNGGSLNISDATVTAGDGVYNNKGVDRTVTSMYGIMVAANNATGTLVVDNCTISAINTASSGVSMYGISIGNGTSASISNSAITGCGYGVNIGSNATGTYNISNCVLTGGHHYSATTQERPGLCVQGAATVYVTGASTVINGAGTGQRAVVVKKAGAIVTISDGYVNGTLSNTSGTLNITGGYYLEGADPANYIDSANYQVENVTVTKDDVTYTMHVAAKAVTFDLTASALTVELGGEAVALPTAQDSDVEIASWNGGEGYLTINSGFTVNATAKPDDDIILTATSTAGAIATLTVHVADYVATIGDVKFESVSAAVSAAANGQTVTLLKDSTENARVYLNSKTIILNLAGYTYRNAYNGATGVFASPITVFMNSNLTIKSDPEGGKIIATGANASAIYIDMSSTVNIQGGDIEGYSGVTIFSNSTLNITGGAVKGTETGINGNGSAGYAGTTVTISGGSVTSDGIAIYHPQNGALNISGGTISGTTAVYAKSGSINITGGSLVGNGDLANYSYNGNGANATGDALVIDSCGYPGGAPVPSVIGGTFRSVNASGVASYNGNNIASPVTGFVAGGYFSSAVPAEYCVDGLMPAMTSDEQYVATPYTVGVPVAQIGDEKFATFDEAIAAADEVGASEITILDGTVESPYADWKVVDGKLVRKGYVAQIGETKYETLEEAVAAVQTGETIKMLSDVTLSAAMDVAIGTKEVILDLGGKTLTGRTNLKSGSLTVQNGTVAGGNQQALNVYGSEDPAAENYSVLTIAGTVQVTADVYGVCLFGKMAGGNGYGAVVNLAGTVSTTGDGSNGAVFVSGNLGKNVEGDAKNVINVTGTITSATDAAIALNGLATVNVLEGAEVVGNTAIAVKRGTLNVEGGTIRATGAKNYPPYVNNNGTEMTGAAISISDTYSKYGALAVAVSGGIVKSSNADALYMKDATYQSDASMVVCGGYFSTKVPVEFCATGLVPTTKPTANGLYTVVAPATVTYTLAGTEGNPANAALPDPASFTYPSGDLAEIALAVATCTDNDYTFGGWQIGGTTKVVSALPAGTEGDVTLVATWTKATKIEIVIDVPTQEEPQATETVEIKVTDDWVADNVTVDQGATDEEKAAAIVQALNTKQDNDLTGLENYLLGLDGNDPNAKVKVESEQGASETAMPVKNTLAEKVQTADTGFTVKYSLDKVNKDGAVVENGEGVQQETSDLELNLKEATSGESSVAYYKMTATITKTVTTGDQPTEVEVSTVHSENTVGVMKVESQSKTTVIGVPWTSLSDDGSISVADIVRTSTLSEGDQIQVYDTEANGYRSWTLDKNGVWQSDTVVGGASSEEANNVKIDRGKGVLLTRKGDTSKPIYLVGEAPTNTVSTTLEKATDSNTPAWNLVASPSVEAKTIEQVVASTDDTIIVPTDSAPRNYTYKDGMWGYSGLSTETITNKLGIIIVRPVRVTGDTQIPAGRGFWYLNKNTSDNEKKINW